MSRFSNTAAGVLAIATALACTSDATAPPAASMTALDVGATTGAVESVRYEATCTLKYRDVVHAAGTAEKILGTGTCKVFPWGRATVTFEGIEVENELGLVFEGYLSYRFVDDSRLHALVRLNATGEANAASLPMEVLQTFRRGTGKLATVNGGTGTGTATLWESAYELRYVTAGHVLFAIADR